MQAKYAYILKLNRNLQKKKISNQSFLLASHAAKNDLN